MEGTPIPFYVEAFTHRHYHRNLSIGFRYNGLFNLVCQVAMMNIRQAVIDLGFRTLGMTGVPKMAVPYTRGLGAILMLHHVRPWHGSEYAPNRELEITPEFFDAVLQHLRRSGWIVVTMDEALERIAKEKAAAK